jgi:hypothetical protein
MYTVTVTRPEGHTLRIHTTTRQHVGRITQREQARGSEIVSVEFPEDK